MICPIYKQELTDKQHKIMAKAACSISCKTCRLPDVVFKDDPKKRFNCKYEIKMK